MKARPGIDVYGVEEDGDEIFTKFEDTRCWQRFECGGAKLEKRGSLHWRCPKCGGYYGEVAASPPEGQIP